MEDGTKAIIAVVASLVAAAVVLVFYIGSAPPNIAESVKDNFLASLAIVAATIYGCGYLLYKGFTTR